MEKLRNKKILTIIVLVVAIVGLSVGFAAFSSVLTISSEAQVNPDASTFSVKFSKVSNEVLDGEANLVYPVGLNKNGALINNTTNPTITGLKAEFTAPGESVVYKFYVRNEGEYLAYLNSIEIGSKSCTPGTGTNTSLVSDACDAINVSVKVGSMNEVTSTQKDITGQTLAAGSYQEVIVTIAYAENGARADGPFSVKLGDVYLTYSSIQDFEFIPNGTYACTAQAVEYEILNKTEYGSSTNTDVNINTPNTVNLITCGSESFYEMSNDGTKITMLSQNLLSNTSPYKQTEITSSALKTQYVETSSESSPNLITPYLNVYEEYLKSDLNLNSAKVRLMTPYELGNYFGLFHSGGSWDFSNIPDWILNPEKYWISDGTVMSDAYSECWLYEECFFYIRPVVEISTSQVQM